MTLAELLRLLQNASPFTMAIGAGYLLVKEVVILGKYHRQIVERLEKDNAKLEDENLQLRVDERQARELAWKATDIGKYLIGLQEQKVSNDTT